MKTYIEKYDPIEGFLLADFVEWKDYNKFISRIRKEDYGYDERTMLFIENLKFTGGEIPKPGKVYPMPYQFFESFKWTKEPGYLGKKKHYHHRRWPEDKPESDISETEMGYSDIISFRAEANYYGKSYFEKPITYKNIELFAIPNKKRWEGPPCGGRKLHDNIKVVVKNVGQGNWNEVYSDNKCCLIFDIGASIFLNNLEMREIVDNSMAFMYKPSLILSHWDIDHYIALFQVPNTRLSKLCCAFFPIELPNLTSQRAYHRLYHYCPYTVPYSASNYKKQKRRIGMEKIFEDKNFALFRGEKSSDRNKSGLSIAVWNEDNCMILPGDHHYHQVFDDIYNSIPENLTVNMVVPHHGGHAGKIRIPQNLFSVGLGVISTGKNHYGHPLNENRIALSKIGFKLLRTDYKGKDIEIELK